MKKLSFLILIILSCPIVGSVCVAQQLTDAENLQVTSFSREIDKLKESFKQRIRIRYEISSDEEIVCTGFVLSSSTGSTLENERNRPVYTFSYGLKSSLVRYDEKSPFGKGTAYTHSYTVKVFPDEGTIQFLQIIPQN